jgi:NAD-dependent dihydropyrimidine dehydrogenase PreA subunit
VDAETSPNEEKKGGDSASMTIITTISITAVCIAAILVISALLILKLRKPVLNPIKMEEMKSCTENCPQAFIEQNNSQPYPEYQLIMSENNDHTVTMSVVV